MTKLKRYATLNKIAFSGDKFVSDKLIQERLGDDYDEYQELLRWFLRQLESNQ